jgi:hypothetical protein
VGKIPIESIVSVIAPGRTHLKPFGVSLVAWTFYLNIRRTVVVLHHPMGFKFPRGKTFISASSIWVTFMQKQATDHKTKNKK